MIAQVVRWGNSLALRIPSALAQTLSVKEGRSVELTVKNGNLIVSPVDNRLVYDLEELLSGITNENIHHEVQYGTPIGNESF